MFERGSPHLKASAMTWSVIMVPPVVEADGVRVDEVNVSSSAARNQGS
jgi:hypothetical protein